MNDIERTILAAELSEASGGNRHEYFYGQISGDRIGLSGDIDSFSRERLREVLEVLNAYPAITAMDLSRNKIETLDGLLPVMPNIRTLNLCDNSITGLSDLGLRTLPNLESLFISGNVRMHCLPPDITSTSTLLYLIADNAYLKYLPPDICRLTNLVYLSCRGNYLENVPDTIGGLTELLELDLSNNKLRDLPPSVGNLKKLEALDVSNNYITRLPDTLTGCLELKTVEAYRIFIDSLPYTNLDLCDMIVTKVQGTNIWHDL